MLYSAQITASVEKSADLLGVDFATQFYFESPGRGMVCLFRPAGYNQARWEEER
jgi:hypothetical protein